MFFFQTSRATTYVCIGLQIYALHSALSAGRRFAAYIYCTLYKMCCFDITVYNKITTFQKHFRQIPVVSILSRFKVNKFIH